MLYMSPAAPELLCRYFGYQIDRRDNEVSQCLCSSDPFFAYNVPKAQECDAGNLDMSKRNLTVLPLSENVCIYGKKT